MIWEPCFFHEYGEQEVDMFTTNEGGLDRGFRVVLGLLLMLAGYVSGGTWGIVLGVIGIIPLLTGLVGWCPLYSIFHINTCKIKGI